MNKAELAALENFRVKLPENGTKELDLMYNLLFDVLYAGWAGKVGHYHQSNVPCQIAPEQNGYLYAFKTTGHFRITAHCTLGLFPVDAPEITMDEIKEMLQEGKDESPSPSV